ncbi:MAG: type II toxin-antitoxin system RelE/ParE family toxin [Candidatus Acidiferrales bacterium]
MASVLEYLDRSGRSPYAAWFKGLHAEAAAKVVAALVQLSHDNFSRVEGVGSGVFEQKLNFGPGYRSYFGKDGDSLVILLGGGTKKRQEADIKRAVERWHDYKLRRRQGI